MDEAKNNQGSKAHIFLCSGTRHFFYTFAKMLVLKLNFYEGWDFMALDLKTLIKKTPELKIDVIAGKNGMENKVRWVHVIESPSSSALLNEAELALSTGIELTSSAVLMELIQRLCEKKASGIIISLGYFIEEIPTEARDFCDKNDFPLLVIPNKTGLTTSLSLFANVITLENHEEITINTAFQNAIFSHQNTQAYEIPLTQKGIKPDYSFYAATVYLDSADDDYEKLSMLSFHIQLYIEKKKFKNTSIFPYNDVVIIVFWDYNREEIAEHIQELADYLKNEIPKDELWLIGVGKKAHSVRCLYKSFDQATELQNLQFRHIIPRDHYHFDNLGVYYLLMSVDNKDVYTRYYNQTLGPILEHDINNEYSLSDILKYYLEHNGSVQETAEHFYLHRNSINYRLKQIQELLDVNLSDLDARIQLRLAYMVRDMLD